MADTNSECMEKEFNVYRSISTHRPLRISDRKIDLVRMLAVRGSFVLNSLQKNGTTTLMINYAALREGAYIDCSEFSRENYLLQLENEIERDSKHIVLLDEIMSLYHFINDDDKSLDYLTQLSQRKQLIIRIHREKSSTAQRITRLKDNGFEIVEIGKIPYDEFMAIFQREFAVSGFNVPERFIKYAHSQFSQLDKQVNYVAEAFRLMVGNPSKEFTEREVEERTKHLMHGGTYRCESAKY
jgi:hypothetical protein